MQPKHLSDPVIDEVREVRHRISARCGHDPDRLVAYYLQLQEQFRDRLIESAGPPAAPSAAEPAVAADGGGVTAFPDV